MAAATRGKAKSYVQYSLKVDIPFLVGDMEANAVSVRVHGKGNLGAKPRAEAIAEILSSIKERRA